MNARLQLESRFRLVLVAHCSLRKQFEFCFEYLCLNLLSLHRQDSSLEDLNSVSRRKRTSLLRTMAAMKKNEARKIDSVLNWMLQISCCCLWWKKLRLEVLVGLL